MTVPSFGHVSSNLSPVCPLNIEHFLAQDGHWSKMHYFSTAFSPLPISQLLLLVTKGLKGFEIYVGLMPLPAMLVILGTLLLLHSIPLTQLIPCSINSSNTPLYSAKLEETTSLEFASATCANGIHNGHCLVELGSQ